jgi:hypothetical protein
VAEHRGIRTTHPARTRPALLLVTVAVMYLWLQGCGSPPASPATTPVPTVDVDAAVQRAVATAQAQERTGTTTPGSTPNVVATVQAAVSATLVVERAGREAWLRAGREFFAIDDESQTVALGWALVIADPSGPVDPTRLTEWGETTTRVRKVVALLPLPKTAAGQAILDDVNAAFDLLTALQSRAVRP